MASVGVVHSCISNGSLAKVVVSNPILYHLLVDGLLHDLSDLVLLEKIAYLAKHFVTGLAWESHPLSHDQLSFGGACLLTSKANWAATPFLEEPVWIVNPGWSANNLRFLLVSSEVFVHLIDDFRQYVETTQKDWPSGSW